MADDRRNDLGPKTKFFNVILLGFAFMFVFTGFQTCGMISQTVLTSYKVPPHKDFNVDGYTSLSIIYIVFALANWIAPSIVSFLGPKCSMFFSAMSYTTYIAFFIKPFTATIYAGSVLIGIGAAVLWTAQGNFLTLNSDDLTMGRNSGIFWALLQCSLLFGNLYVFFAWQGVSVIKDEQRIPLYIGLTAICGFGTLLMIFLRPHPKTSPTVDSGPLITDDQESQDSREQAESAVNIVSVTKSKKWEAWEAFLKAVELFKTRDMILLSVTFFYTGLELTFFSGVYANCVGSTRQLGEDSDHLEGLVGIMIGVGEIFGGATFGIFGKRTVKYGRDPVVLLGMCVHLVAFFLIFLNIPSEAPIHRTDDIAHINPSVVLAVGCGVLLGFADACFNTQCFSILGVMFPDHSAPAFALFKFEQSLAAAVGFFYSRYVTLQWQLLILVVFAVLGTLCFFLVENKLKRKIRARERGLAVDSDNSSDDSSSDS